MKYISIRKRKRAPGALDIPALIVFITVTVIYAINGNSAANASGDTRAASAPPQTIITTDSAADPAVKKAAADAPAAPAAEAAARANAGDDTAINRDSIGRIIHGLIDEMDDGTGWVRTSRVGDQLIKRYPDFDVRNFGSKSLNKFLASLPELEVEERILANGNPIQFVRVKPVPKPVKKPAPRRTAKRTTRKKK